MEITYKGYEARSYGYRCAEIKKDGKVVLHTTRRTWEDESEEKLKDFVNIYIAFTDTKEDA